MATSAVAPPQPATRTPLTADDLLELEAEHGSRYELVRGELKERHGTSEEYEVPNAKHGLTAGNLFGELWSYTRDNNLGAMLIECGFILADEPRTVRIPDIAFLSTDRLPSEGLPAGYIRGAPDLAVEVVSPSDKAADLAQKVADYLDAGTRLVWVVEPHTRTVTVYKPGGDAQYLDASGTLDGGDVLPCLSLPVEGLFTDMPAVAPS